MKSQAVPEMYLFLIELVLVVMSGWIIYEKVSSIENDHIFEQKFFARDLALLVNILPAAHGNLAYVYSRELLNKNDVSISKEFVQVGEAKYPVTLPENEQLNLLFEKPPRLNFYSEGGKINIDDNINAELNVFQLSCPAIETPITRIIIDPAHGTGTGRFSGSEGLRGVKGAEAEVVLPIAASLIGNSRARNIPAESTRSTSLQEAKRVSERIAVIPRDATIIGISAAKEERHRNVLKIYLNAQSPNYEKSYALACRILNKITKENAVTGASIVPVDISRLRQDDTETADIDEQGILTVLLADNQGVYIELGNIDNPNNTLLQASIAEQLFEALR
ncbi:MAG: N-acetylmuramoyl-L-alanine amidase [Candidatus Aenigmarchaeota archaeon]|nr:N-acetylmuramoyl-L-alanine amidase [Candidatus Aenigmarchaeota archaeon]